MVSAPSQDLDVHPTKKSKNSKNSATAATTSINNNVICGIGVEMRPTKTHATKTTKTSPPVATATAMAPGAVQLSHHYHFYSGETCR